MKVIYFNCVHCREELEAERSLRGKTMACPECRGEVEVPHRGLRNPAQGTTRLPRSLPGVKLFLISAGVGLAAFLLFLGAGYVLMRHLGELELNLPRCGVCDGSGTKFCMACNGSCTFMCPECNGSGTHTNVYDEPEPCYVCGGGGRADCRVCGGKGKHSCVACRGGGVVGGKTTGE